MAGQILMKPLGLRVSAYRESPRQLSVAPPAPWWRLLRAWAGGISRRIEKAKERRYQAHWTRHESYFGLTYQEMTARLERMTDARKWRRKRR